MRSHKPITKTAAWKHEHEFVNTTTRWDNYPPQTIKWWMVSANHEGEKRRVSWILLGCMRRLSRETPLLFRLVYYHTMHLSLIVYIIHHTIMHHGSLALTFYPLFGHLKFLFFSKLVAALLNVSCPIVKWQLYTVHDSINMRTCGSPLTPVPMGLFLACWSSSWIQEAKGQCYVLLWAVLDQLKIPCLWLGFPETGTAFTSELNCAVWWL